MAEIKGSLIRVEIKIEGITQRGKEQEPQIRGRIRDHHGG